MRLNENIIKQKTKTADLEEVKQLNCCGWDLTDISILECIPNVEVLSLSYNEIESLEPLQRCLKLQTLYVRQNKIQDIQHVAVPQNLPVLTSLVLSENPLCEALGTKYRAAVLRCLPNLKILDEMEVRPAEQDQAALETKEELCFDSGASSSELFFKKQPSQQAPGISNPGGQRCSLPLMTEAKDGNETCQPTELRRSESFSLPCTPLQEIGIFNMASKGTLRPCSTNIEGASRRMNTTTNSADEGSAPAQILYSRNPQSSGGLHAQLGEMGQRELLTSALCLVEYLDLHGLTVLDGMVSVYLSDFNNK